MSLETLQPTTLWQHFVKICSIPHPSQHEDILIEYVLALADRLGLVALQDKAGNVIIRKPATEKMADCPGVVLQAHLDMVPQKISTHEHDFTKDPIQVYIDGDWVTAKGTTLGADNGIGLAAILAILESNELQHGPLEALLTVNEESGMTGAKGLEKGLLKGRILVNTDSEHEGQIFAGCAGGVDINVTAFYREQTVPSSLRFYEITLSGLQGGHSGLNIDDYRGNAIKMMVRFLKGLPMDEFALAAFKGGTLRNAIPRDAVAVIGVVERQKDLLHEYIKQTEQLYRDELAAVEPDFELTITPAGQPSSVMFAEDVSTWLNILHVSPSGVYRMSDHFEGVVETSNNLAVVVIEQGSIRVNNLTRSLVNSARDDHALSIAGLYELAGAEVEIEEGYPGWKPDHTSSVLKLVKKIHTNLFDYVPEVKVIHAGLECGLLGEKYPEWDMVSFGPLITGAHSPDERANIESVEKFWRLLTQVLKAIPSDLYRP